MKRDEKLNTTGSFFSKKKNIVIIAIFYTFLWGTAFPLVKMCMQNFGIADSDNMSKCLVAGIRFTFAGVLTLMWCFSNGKRETHLNSMQIKYILLYGILATALQYSFTYIALSKIDGSKGAIFDQICVFIIILTSGVFFKDDVLNVSKIVGCVLGFLGILAVNSNGMKFEFTLGGEGIMLCAALCQTVAYFVAKKSANLISASWLVGYGQLFGGILLWGFAVINGGRIHSVNCIAIISLVALAAISAVAYVLSLLPLKYFPASEISSFNLLISVFGVIMSALLLGEDILRWNYGISLLLVSLGIMLVNYKKPIRINHKKNNSL